MQAEHFDQKAFLVRLLIIDKKRRVAHAEIINCFFLLASQDGRGENLRWRHLHQRNARRQLIGLHVFCRQPVIGWVRFCGAHAPAHLLGRQQGVHAGGPRTCTT